MKSLKLLISLTFIATILTISLTLDPESAQAQVAGEFDSQQTQWGLETEGISASMNFKGLGYALEETQNRVFVGGKFLDITNGKKTIRQPYIAAFETDGGEPVESFTPNLEGPVFSIELAPDGDLFVGGKMNVWNGTSIGALAKIDPITGELDKSFKTRIYGGSSVIRDITLEPDGWLYAVGSFTIASDTPGNPKTVKNVVRMSPTTGTIDWSWLPQPQPNPSKNFMTGAVWGVSASRTTDVVYLGGWFSINGKPVVGIDTNDANDIVWDGFQGNVNYAIPIYDVQATPFGTVMVAGVEHASYLFDENNNMELIMNHLTEGADGPVIALRRGGDNQSIILDGEDLYVTCHCWGEHYSSSQLFTRRPFPDQVTSPFTGNVSAIVKYNARTGVRDQTFQPYMAGNIGGFDTLVATDGCVWNTGGYTAVGQPGNQQRARDLVRLCPSSKTEVELSAPQSCTATIIGDVVNIELSAVAGADRYSAYRTLNGGNQNWRGVTTGTTLSDTNIDADLIYYISARAGSKTSAKTMCATMQGNINLPVGDLKPVASCSANVAGNNVNVTWPSAGGASEYVIYRSVDGGQQYWRGRSESTSFTDSNRNAPLTYYVTSKAVNGTKSTKTECNSDQNDNQAANGNLVCEVNFAGANNKIDVTWNNIAGASDYVIFRTVNGSQQWWRGKTVNNSFSDSKRAGNIEYYVAVKTGNVKSQPSKCSNK